MTNTCKNCNKEVREENLTMCKYHRLLFCDNCEKCEKCNEN